MGKIKEKEEKDALAKELRSLIPKLDEEGLSFLIEQANIHLYNMEVEKLNSKIAGTASPQKGSGKTGTKKAKPGAPPPEDMHIEASESGSSYYIVFQGKWIMFSRDEMIQLVKIASVKDTDLEIRGRLYVWLENERRDVFSSIPIRDKFDDRLKALAKMLKTGFKLR
jgi:hypothetical protein